MKSYKETRKKIIELFETLPREERRRMFYTLDYIINYIYFQRGRRIPVLEELGFEKELQKLKEQGIVLEEKSCWRSNEYRKLSIADLGEKIIKNLLIKEYYPLFIEHEVKKKFEEIICKFLPASSRLFIKSKRSNFGEITLEQDDICLGKELSENELGYFIGNYTDKYFEYYNEFIFRSEPFDTKSLFFKIFEEKIVEEVKKFTPVMKWCAYLNLIRPDCNKEFLLKNTTSRFLVGEIESEGCKVLELKIGEIGNMIEALKNLIFTEEKERLNKVMIKLMVYSPKIVEVLGALILLSKPDKEYYLVDNIFLDWIKNNFQHSYDKLSLYINELKNNGIILEASEGIIIPQITCEVLEEVIRKSGKQEVKIFESSTDAYAFIEEQLMKAKVDIKIWDPYVSAKTLAIVEKTLKTLTNVTVEIISSQPSIKSSIESLIKKGLRLRSKIIYKIIEKDKVKSPFHDRYVIIDEKYVWHFGPSMDAAGEKGWESASLFPENLGKTIVDGFKYNWCKRAEEWKKEGYDCYSMT